MRMRPSLTLLLYLAAVFIMPLAGVAVSGQAIAPFLTFPPQTRVTEAAPFSWPAFGLVTLLIAVSLAPFLWTLARSPNAPAAAPDRRPFPWFGWVGGVLLGATWFVAWHRFDWAAAFQRHTFTPLWLGYVLVINASTAKRSGACPLTSEPRLLLTLFPLSAAVWWSFEYLNRFVSNWYYVGLEHLSAGQYALEATLPFSTVLPAVYSTAAWLATFPAVARGLDHFISGRPADTSRQGSITAAAAASLLALMALRPAELFPLVWIAPPLLAAGLQQRLLGRSLLHRAFASGDFRRLWVFALAALVCGLFWELWNVRSLAHWQYQIPYVGRFHLFAMPLLGYAGYLPFGIACGLFIDFARDMLGRRGAAGS